MIPYAYEVCVTTKHIQQQALKVIYDVKYPDYTSLWFSFLALSYAARSSLKDIL